ncbi:MAG: YaaL family protein [Defluviitaleaceae bacterium]|nr:YaaL family protein [Defluviitaleaceae bacterium]
MTNAASAPAIPAPREKEKLTKRSRKRLSREDMEIVEALEAVKSDMDFLHNCFDHTTDAVLVDSLVYELKACNLKFQYYLNLCKEKGIVHSGAPNAQ